MGYLACGDTGAGKMPEPETLYQYILRETRLREGHEGAARDGHGRADAGGQSIRCATSPIILPVKMGYAIARRAMLPGRRCDARIRTDRALRTGAICDHGPGGDGAGDV